MGHGPWPMAHGALQSKRRIAYSIALRTLKKMLSFGAAMVGVQTTVHGVFLYLYASRRHLPPIRQRFPRYTLAASTSLSLCLTARAVQNTLPDTYPFLIPSIVVQVFALGFLCCNIVLALQLYLAFRKTFAQLNYVADEAPILPVSAKMITPGQSWAFIVISVVLFSGTQIGCLVADPTALSVTQRELATHPATGCSLLAGSTFLLISGIAFTGLILQINLKVDSHGLKRQLNQMGLCIVGGIGLGIIIWIAGIERAWAPSLLPYVSGNAIFAISVVLPVLATLRRRQIVPSSCDSRSLLPKFLETPDGYQSFRQYLSGCFAVENLLFYHDTQQFRAEFRKDSQGSKRAAIRIFKLYLASGAPLEVNLSGEVTSKFRDNVFRDPENPLQLHDEVFEYASQQILHLMEVNYLLPFTVVASAVWQKFQASLAELEVLDEINKTDNSSFFTSHEKEGNFDV